MSHLLRSHAPITEAGWELLDQEARERLAPALGARRCVDYLGPHGWQHSATNLGRTDELAAGANAVKALQRRVLPLVELRADFAIARTELRDADRGADDPDLDPLVHASHQIAAAEGAAVFHGWGKAIIGIAQASPHSASKSKLGADAYPARVATAVDTLLNAGVGGPYALAVDSDQYQTVLSATEPGGYLLSEHLEKILGGPVVWVPGLSGAIVLSLRGGDFLFDSGQDLSVGYDSHDGNEVRLYLEESFSFHVATPEAAVVLRA